MRIFQAIGKWWSEKSFAEPPPKYEITLPDSVLTYEAEYGERPVLDADGQLTFFSNPYVYGYRVQAASFLGVQRFRRLKTS